MSLSSPGTLILACALVVACSACATAPGMPTPGPEVPRPAEVLDFATLYSQNCAACHGAQGKLGAAISLGNPVYIAVAGVANIQRVTSAGISGSLMPPFAINAGGMLTAHQIEILAQGIVARWGNSSPLQAPSYTGTAPGDAAKGQASFSTFCSRCHANQSLTDPAYLALISNQGLRSIIIAGQPGQGMPDWRSCLTGPGARAMTDQEVTDIVAWLASNRIETPGQPYQQPKQP